jgi:hypothetical protein
MQSFRFWDYLRAFNEVASKESYRCEYNGISVDRKKLPYEPIVWDKIYCIICSINNWYMALNLKNNRRKLFAYGLLRAFFGYKRFEIVRKAYKSLNKYI